MVLLFKSPSTTSGEEKENERTEHSKISAGITDHEPKTLGWARKFGELRRDDRCADDDKQWNRSTTSPKSNENQRAAKNFERAHEVRGERRMREANPDEASHAHVGVDEFQDALGKEDQAYGQTNEENGCGAVARLQEESGERIHVGRSGM
jgi:hypothetical protein